jgi:thymidylate kinase
MNRDPGQIRCRLFTRFFGALEQAKIDYVIVGRTDGFPQQVVSDVDFIVRPADLQRVVDIVWEWHEMALLHQVLQHEIGAFYFVLTARSGNDFVHFHPDVSTDYRRSGRHWLTADYLLAGRVRDAGEFWKPTTSAAFAYYLVKRIDKLSLDEPRVRYLHGLYLQSPAAAEEVGRRLLGNAAWDSFSMCLSGHAAASQQDLQIWRAALMAHAGRESALKSANAWVLELRRKLRRVLQPTGLVVAVLGPDGAGKSTVISGLQRELGQLFRRTDYFHLRPRMVRSGGAGAIPSTNPHGQPPRGLMASTAKLVMYVADTVAGYALRVFALKRRSSLVIFDRYPHDVLADPKRYRVSTPRWLNALLLRPIPAPDIWLVLDAPAAVLLARKAEVSLAACEAQLAGYRRLLQELPHAVSISTTKSEHASIADACEAVLSRLRERLVRPIV